LIRRPLSARTSKQKGNCNARGVQLKGGVAMRDVSTKQASLTVVGITVVLAAVFYLATFFKA
uniref:hypothetical protein n=1 Tax=Bradyrhizobium sp. sBnM-33 TaxID=2831780 RepID=UPI001BCB756B